MEKQVEAKQERKVHRNELTTSTKKRPNKAKLMRQAELRGHLTANEQLMITGLTVKNLLQRINTKGFEEIIRNADCKKIEKLMKTFVEEVDEILKTN